MYKIGIVGLGIMGRGIANNFLKHGYEVLVWNRTRGVAESLEHEHLTICESPKEVAEKSEVIFEITANDESSELVWYGENGILAGSDSTKVLIVSSTLSAEYTDKLSVECKSRNLKLLDIPLTGGRIGAETGNLTLLCGGEENLVEELRPTFEAIAGNVIYFGPSGHGMRYKLILNFVQASHIIAFGQAMKIANAQGMDLSKVSEGLALRPGGIITNIAKDAYFKEPNPITFSIDWITKDLEYAKKMAGDIDVSVLDTVLKYYKNAQLEGMGNGDWMTINKML